MTTQMETISAYRQSNHAKKIPITKKNPMPMLSICSENNWIKPVIAAMPRSISLVSPPVFLDRWYSRSRLWRWRSSLSDKFFVARTVTMPNTAICISATATAKKRINTYVPRSNSGIAIASCSLRSSESTIAPNSHGVATLISCSTPTQLMAKMKRYLYSKKNGNSIFRVSHSSSSRRRLVPRVQPAIRSRSIVTGNIIQFSSCRFVNPSRI